jgi:hypothetical protein
MKYNFIKLNGEIVSTNNLSTIKKGLTWDKLNNFMPIWNFKKEENDFLKRWGLSNSVFNVGCIHNLGMVYLPEFFYNQIIKMKGGIK